MGERRPLGRACRAAGELDVDRIVELQPRRKLAQPPGMTLPACGHDIGKAEHAGTLIRADADHCRQQRQARRRKVARHATV
jgi:hypothetical protein